jgi:hypothetical protein
MLPRTHSETERYGSAGAMAEGRKEDKSEATKLRKIKMSIPVSSPAARQIVKRAWIPVGYTPKLWQWVSTATYIWFVGVMASTAESVTGLALVHSIRCRS